MEAYLQLIKSIEPQQKEMTTLPDLLEDLIKVTPNTITETKSVLVQELEIPLESHIKDIKKQFQLDDPIRIIPNGRKRNLYTSLLSLVDKNYALAVTYEDKYQMVSDCIKFLIAQMTLNTTIKNVMSQLKVKPEQLIDEIKDEGYQSPLVVYYVSLVFDVNLVILHPVNQGYEIEYCYGDQVYDDCKPHLLLYRDQNQIYSPIIYGQASQSQLLTYYDHPIIQKLSQNYNKKVICQTNYLKPVKLIKDKVGIEEIQANPSMNLKTLTVAELRDIAKSCQVETMKISDKTGKKVYKTKAELLVDLSGGVTSN